MKYYATLPNKWKASEGYGRCRICEKWKSTMYFILDGGYVSLCERDFYDLKGD